MSSPTPDRPVVVVMGVSAVGKSSVARELARLLELPMQDADDLHPAENVAKMASGEPLTDDDRWPWLAKVSAWITDHTTHWGLQIDQFWWTAIWAAIVLSIVGWLFSLPLRDAERR